MPVSFDTPLCTHCSLRGVVRIAVCYRITVAGTRYLCRECYSRLSMKDNKGYTHFVLGKVGNDE